jgi:hypothetical protein
VRPSSLLFPDGEGRLEPYHAVGGPEISLRFYGLTLSFTPSVDWKKLLAKQIQPPCRPNVKIESPVDCSNVDEGFTSEDPVDRVVEDRRSRRRSRTSFLTSATPTGMIWPSVLTALPCRSEGRWRFWLFIPAWLSRPVRVAGGRSWFVSRFWFDTLGLDWIWIRSGSARLVVWSSAFP